jgi:hypothetical protein
MGNSGRGDTSGGAGGEEGGLTRAGREGSASVKLNILQERAI